MPLITTLAFEPRLEAVIQDYRVQKISLEATAVHEFSLQTKLLISGLFEQYDITADSIARIIDVGISTDRKLVFQLERDTRPLDAKFNPWRGSYTTYRFEYVGGFLGGSDSFTKAVFNWAKYNRVFGSAVFANRLRLGWVDEFGGGEYVPSRDRFYLGGAFTVRGFDENTIFPPADTLVRDTIITQVPVEDSLTADTAVVASGILEGGEAIGLLNLELRLPLFWQFWSSIFVDCGVNAPELHRVAFDQFVLSAGIGLQFMSPVGPIRVDYGQRIGINDVDPGGRIHLSILYSF
jgi:outer membrane protein insertion porin family